MPKLKFLGHKGYVTQSLIDKCCIVDQFEHPYEVYESSFYSIFSPTSDSQLFVLFLLMFCYSSGWVVVDHDLNLHFYDC